MTYQLLYERNNGGQGGEDEEIPERESDSYEETRPRKSSRTVRGSHRKHVGDEDTNAASSAEMEELCW